MHPSFHPLMQPSSLRLYNRFSCAHYTACNKTLKRMKHTKKKADDNNKNNSRGLFFRKFFDFFWHLTIQHTHSLAHTHGRNVLHFIGDRLNEKEEEATGRETFQTRRQARQISKWTFQLEIQSNVRTVARRKMFVYFSSLFACLRSSKNNHFFPLRL